MKTKGIRGRLKRERARLEELRRDLTAGGRRGSEREELSELSSVDQHPADLGSEMFERTKEQAILGQIDRQLTEVAHALRRLETGAYGRCEACGRPIGAARLEALPAARFCVQDQARAEREVAANTGASPAFAPEPA